MMKRAQMNILPAAFAILTVCVSLASHIACAQPAYPTRPIRIIVPTSPPGLFRSERLPADRRRTLGPDTRADQWRSPCLGSCCDGGSTERASV